MKTETKKISYGAGIFVLENFLTEQACQHYLELSVTQQWEDAAIQTAEGQRIYTEVRNNSRIIFDDQDLAYDLFKKAQPYLPEVMGDDCVLKGFNERFRYYRYYPGEYFKWHKDGIFARNDNEMSQLTFLIYLNDGYEGGETEFKWDVIQPKKGMALVFPHLFLHQGKSLKSGIKYVLRTDVMYART